MRVIHHPRKEQLLGILIGLILSFTIIRFFPSLLEQNWLAAMLIPVIMLGSHYREKLNAIFRVAVLGINLTVILVFGFRNLQTIRSLAIYPPVWDFQTFWLDGRVAVEGLNFYDSENYHKTAQALNPDKEFTQEILDVGFRYPPMTMFLFAPLGLFDIRTAAIFWYILQGVFLILDILLLWKLFLWDDGLNGLIFVSALALAFPPIIINIWVAQTNFILLLILLLYWRERMISRAGIWLAIGIIIKPYVALVFVYLLLKRQWKVAASTLITLVVVSLLSLVAFGLATFIGYFESNPIRKLPPWYFSELGNGSLYAIIWRLFTGFFGEQASGLIQPVFLAISICLLAITSWLVYWMIQKYDDWALALVISLALLLYPNTGANYCVVLIVPILLYWVNRNDTMGGIWGIVFFAALESALLGYHNGWSNFVFVAVLFSWLLFSVFGALFVLRERDHHIGTNYGYNGN